MNVKTLIKYLKQDYGNDDEIIVSYWDRQWFNDRVGVEITDDEWQDIQNACDNVMDYCSWGDDLAWAAKEIIDKRENK